MHGAEANDQSTAACSSSWLAGTNPLLPMAETTWTSAMQRKAAGHLWAASVPQSEKLGCRSAVVRVGRQATQSGHCPMREADTQIARGARYDRVCDSSRIRSRGGDRPFRAVWCALLEKHVEGQSLRRRAPSADFILSVQIGTLCSTECCPSRCRRFSPYVQVSAFAETPQRLKSAPSPRLRCCERRPVIAGNFRGRPGRTR